jgi:multicomponent Na+:H+ antiporter subunit F
VTALHTVIWTILLAGAVVLALLLFAALIRALIGPRFTDRIIAVNMINTMVVALLCILSVYFSEEYLVDVALVYALLSFLTVVILSRIVTLREKRKRMKREGESGHDR